MMNQNELEPVEPAELTMTHLEIAEVVDSRPDKVKQSMERLQNKGLISFTPMGVKPTDELGRGRPHTVYSVNQRDSYVVVAQLSPEFTARLVDRWAELEAREAIREAAKPQPQIPQSFADALQLAADLQKKVELDAPKVAYVEEVVDQAKNMMTLGVFGRILKDSNKAYVTGAKAIPFIRNTFPITRENTLSKTYSQFLQKLKICVIT